MRDFERGDKVTVDGVNGTHVVLAVGQIGKDVCVAPDPARTPSTWVAVDQVHWVEDGSDA